MIELHSPDPSRLSLVMRTLGDPTRRSLFEEIVRRGESRVLDLTPGSGISQPAVSQHLKSLREAGLVRERRSGRHAYYRPEPAGMAPLVDWLDLYSTFWRDRFSVLKDLLQEIDPK